ncbi:hypothetical protein TrST_g9638 [Triparma strigata]|uniref:Uncharacterized protein n=1 Tax=Triparma strigata TaxID=1606541 RepID=A0A9W6ZU94_9STRA|nr:hypothetical protein TrST_g9638 [Triparma strigata]
MPSPLHKNRPPPNFTSPSSKSGTFFGLFGHANINTEDNWSWENDVKDYRQQADLRQQELHRHRHLQHARSIRDPKSLPKIDSTYERGMKDYQKVQIGTPAMGEWSRIEAIQSSDETPRNPILEPGDGEYGVGVVPPPRKSYDPILQRYPDELEEDKRKAEEGGEQKQNKMSAEERKRSVAVIAYEKAMEKQRLQWEHKELQQQLQPHPPTAFNKGVKDYTMARERATRTQDWMPGRPKGGRSYKEPLRDPILKDAPDPEVVEQNQKISEKYQEEQKVVFNEVFQTFPDPRAQVRADREWMEEREKKIKNALNRRMVREGGYDPVTLRDRRTGDEVGPLPDSQIGHKVESIAGNLAKQHMTGAHVAYALGSDRYGDPDANNHQNVKVHQAHIDHVSMIMSNEGRIESGFHDLESRTKIPTNVEMLMDVRYADQFDVRDEDQTTWANTSINPNVNSFVPNLTEEGAGATGTSKLNYTPNLTASHLLNSDTMTTWVPSISQKHYLDPHDAGMVYNDNRVNEKYKNMNHVAKGAVIADVPVRIWPEEKKAISRSSVHVDKGI